MKKARLVLDKDYTISEVDPRIYGSFVEHLGRCVYTGIYEPGHPSADRNGFRQDVLKLVRGLNIPLVRYPGGNFASALKWEDSVGPREKRPRRLDPAWKTTETNEVGLHEFAEWAKLAGAELLYTINLGTRSPENARDLIEYANHPGGSYWSDLRRQNGSEDPFDIKLWGLGNEMDGTWQMGFTTAEEYGKKANEAAKQMKQIDRNIEVVACGSTNPDMDTYGQWEYTVLNQCYDNIDYISMHRYYNNYDDDTANFLARTMDLEAYIRTVSGYCDAVQGKKHSKKRIFLSLDEWNVWYHSHEKDKIAYETNPWGTALPLIEDVYNVTDALLVGLILITIIKHADRIKIACLAQLVNVIAPIMTRPGGDAWAQTIYWPLMQASMYGRGISLMPKITCGKYDSRLFSDVPEIDAAAVQRDDWITIFAVNRDLEHSVVVDCDLRGFGIILTGEWFVLHSDDLKAENTEAEPDRIVPVRQKLDFSDHQIILKPASWNVIRLKIEHE